MPDYAKDVMLGVLGASVGLGGLLLVFCGLVFAQAASFPPATTDDATINRYKNAGKLGLWPFLGAVLDSLLVTVWFVCQSGSLYFVTLGLFVALLVATALYGAVVIRSYL